ncbi:hypothetical protein D3C80_364510 [compost metagenome]
MLTPGESLEYIAVQKKPAVNISPDCIALTSKRIIFFHPKNLGLSMEFQDYLWKDIEDCHFKEGFLGAEFMIKTIIGTTVTMDYLPKVQARKLYQFAQHKSEEMQDYRRQIELENKRASAGGGVVVNSASTPELPQQPAAPIESVQPGVPKIEPISAPIPPEPVKPTPAESTPSAPVAPSTQQEDPVAVLKKLKAMFDNDLITKAEYDSKKAEILSRM